MSVSNQTEPVGEVDLIVEGNTYTPYFYKGRSEPSPGNLLRLTAIPKIPGVENYNSLNFYWSIEGEVVRQGEGLSSVEMIAPNLTEILVSLQVSSAGGVLLAKTSKYIPMSSQKIVFYEQNSLRGQSRVALRDLYVISGGEINIIAEPYFMGKNESLNNLIINWTINNQSLNNTNSDWRTITIESPESNETNRVELSIGHRQKLLQVARSSFTYSNGLWES